jgi:hypothetical protein
MTHPIPAELAEILDEIGAAGAFRHRQHIHLAFIATRRYGMMQAADKAGNWIRHLTVHAPQKFNATVTRAWTEIVAHHVAADPSGAARQAPARPALHRGGTRLTAGQGRLGGTEPRRVSMVVRAVSGALAWRQRGVPQKVISI